MEPNSTSKQPMNFEIDGVSYNSIDEMPPDKREKVLKLLAKLEKSGLHVSANFNNTEVRNLMDSDGADAMDELTLEDVDSTLPYKLIMGLILLLAALFFIYIFFSSSQNH